MDTLYGIVLLGTFISMNEVVLRYTKTVLDLQVRTKIAYAMIIFDMLIVIAAFVVSLLFS